MSSTASRFNNSSFLLDDMLTADINDTKITTTQFHFQDDEYFFSKLTAAIFEDFQTKCVSYEELGTTSNLTASFLEVCNDSIAAVRKLSLRAEKSDLFKHALNHLEHEAQAYSLLLLLSKKEHELATLQAERGKYILTDLEFDDIEFRKLKVLLEWSEQNARNDPQMETYIATEMSFLESYDCMRRETLHALKRDEVKYSVDLDAAHHGNLHPKDDQLESRLYSLIYSLIRCGRLDEAITLLFEKGMSGIKPLLEFRRVVWDRYLTPSSETNPLFHCLRGRMSFKRAAKTILEEGALSQMEARIYAVIAGFLQLPLSAAKQTDDRLWCYINSAIECRLDAKFAKCHPAECPLDDVNVKNDDLSVDSIFDEISTSDRSPFYQIYRHLINSDSLSLISMMEHWIEQHVEEIGRYPHILRLMAHLVIILQFAGQPMQEQSACYILEYYVRLLIATKMYKFVPYYASKLPADLAESILVDFMHKLSDEQTRLNVLTAASSARTNTAYLCKRTFEHALQLSQIKEEASEDDDLLCNAWKWLTYNGRETIRDALLGLNEVLRLFFSVGKLEKAKTLMEDAKKSMDRFEESFDLMIEDLKHEFETDSETLKAVHEYQSYQVYLNAVDRFNEWFKYINRTSPSVPNKPSDREWALMDMQQKITFEVIRDKAKDSLEKYKRNVALLEQAATQSLEKVLKFDGGWLRAVDCAQVGDEDKHAEQLVSIRGRCLSSTVVMLIAIFGRCNREELAQLIEVLADDKFSVAELTSLNISEILAQYVSHIFRPFRNNNYEDS